MLTENKTLSVTAIQNGTVIDHINAGKALTIISFLKLNSHEKQITLGLNLPSPTMGYKDIIKVESRELTPQEVNQVALISPKATVSIIENYAVIKKFQVEMPEFIKGFIRCPNLKCITNHDLMETHFLVKQKAKKSCLQCKYCQRTFDDYNQKC